MPKAKSPDTIELLLQAHKRGIEFAKDRSIRTGIPLVIEKNGKIMELKPKYKYIKVPIRDPRKANTKAKLKAKE